jgi:MFS superfamily sulfate permease-like transporter
MPDPSSGLWRAVLRFGTAIPPVPPQALSVFHAAVGAAILAGDSARFSGPSFAGARQIAGLFGVPEPRAWIAWGTLLVVVGVVMVFVWPWFEIHHPRLAVVTVLFGACPMFFLVAGFVASLGLSAVASSSPVGAYGTIALFHLHTAVKMINAGAWDCRRPDGTWERRHVARPRPRVDGWHR